MRKIILSLLVLTNTLPGFGRNANDTIPTLGIVTVKGFGVDAVRLSVPASISILKESELQRHQGTSLLPAMNTLPGVRMEERSPGSYRLSIRGSLLRSPFGVRNVKLYLDDFVFTDAGGNSYLNLLDLNAMSTLEVLRGPSGSTYGTGTGGVVLMSTPSMPQQDGVDSGRKVFEVGLSAGSYGMRAQHLRLSVPLKGGGVILSQGHFQAQGYRQNSSMRRDVVQLVSSHAMGSKGRWQTLLLLSDLAYKTPGGLTAMQQSANPRQARPATAVLPGAITQQAGIMNQSAMLGVSYAHNLSEVWTLKTALTQAVTDFKNPFITNYEKRTEYNPSIRSVLTYDGTWLGRKLVWQSGLEWQQGFYQIDSTGNRAGVPDANLVRDRVGASQGFLFSQADYRITARLLVQIGASLNRFNYQIERTIGSPKYPSNAVDFDLQWVPRIAIVRQLWRKSAWHASVTRGFSPPSLAEIRPSAGGLSTGLQAERGWSRETGMRGSFAKNRIQFDVTYFRFDLSDAIVRRTNAAGAEYFMNTGNVTQKGLEASLEAYPIHRNTAKGLLQLKGWASFTRSDFSFGEYSIGGVSLMGKRLTGIPRRNLATGLDLNIPGGCYLSVTHQFTDSLPLTDINDAFAPSYDLLGARAGWRGNLRRLTLECYVAADNLLNEQYSLGNDLNAFGRRYFNPAAGRNWVVGIRVKR